MKWLKKLIQPEQLIIIFAIAFSLMATAWSYLDSTHLADYDAIARLNIARRIIDSLTPGIGQLGGIWLPLPQLLMVPFVGSNYLWHSGLAGSIVSMLAYIIGSIFIYKTVYLLINSKWASITAWLVWAIHPNLLLFQSSAMSEPFFMFSVAGALYYLTKWSKNKRLRDLFTSALFIILVTLTRYEGYVILLSSIPIILLGANSYTTSEGSKKRKAEGFLIIYLTLASFGVVLWSLYSALIFKDPIYWLSIYTHRKDQIQYPLAGPTPYDATSPMTASFFDSFVTYMTSIVYMNGFIVSIISLLGFMTGIFLLIKYIHNKKAVSSLIPLIIISFSTILFLIVGYRVGIIPNIQLPTINILSPYNSLSNFGSSSNLRYGMILLPFMAVFIGIATLGKRFLSFIFILLILFQTIAASYFPFFLNFNLAYVWKYNIPSYSHWFKEHYDGGLILVSAHRYEPFIFQTGLPYKRFIYEGTQHYWLESLREPSKYASWIVLNNSLKGDAVATYFTDHKVLEKNFTKVFEDRGYKIYKNKTKPKVQIGN